MKRPEEAAMEDEGGAPGGPGGGGPPEGPGGTAPVGCSDRCCASGKVEDDEYICELIREPGGGYV